MKLYLAPYKSQSVSAKNLAQSLGITRIKTEKSGFKPTKFKTVINWGRQDIQVARLGDHCKVLNTVPEVSRASNKLEAFNQMRKNNVRIPDYTQSANEALDWLRESKNSRVVGRRLLRAHSARGMKVFRNGDDVENDPDWRNSILYVKYIPKRHEYRIHVGRESKGGYKVIDIQRKGLREDVERDNANFEIRNLENGFIFVRNDGHLPPDDVRMQAIEATRSLNLDFGAVDVVFNENQGRAYVLEVNTAPGLTGSTVENYAQFFRSFI